MSVPPDELPQLAFAQGLNNRAKETAVPDGAARAMVNVDLVAGQPVVRQGRRMLYASATAHSGWSHPNVAFALFVDGDTLNAMNEAGQVFPIRNGLHPREMHYALVAGRIYYSNDIDTGSVALDMSAGTWGVESPDNTYHGTAIAGGGMDAGEYLVAMTFIDARGQESGAPPPLRLVLEDGQGIQLDQLPQPVDSAVTALRIYVSPANDPRLFHARDAAIGMTSVTINAGPRGRQLETLYLEPFPGCRYVIANNGRLWAATGRVLRWSPALRYGLHDPVNDYMPMPETITGIGAPSDPGLTLFVGTTRKTYVLTGNDAADLKLISAAHVGMVPGSLVHVDPDVIGLQGIAWAVPVWLGTNGQFYSGSANGGINALNKGVVADAYDRVAAQVFAGEDGRRLVMAGRTARKATMAVTDKVVARVVE